MTEDDIPEAVAERVKMRDEISMIELECRKIEAQLKLRELKARLDMVNHGEPIAHLFDLLVWDN